MRIDRRALAVAIAIAPCACPADDVDQWQDPDASDTGSQYTVSLDGGPGEVGPLDSGPSITASDEDDDGASWVCPAAWDPGCWDFGAVSAYECDVWTAGCPEGEKCMPWANDGGPAWNALRCSPLDPNPREAGEACTVEGSGVSGIDNCAPQSMCWDVDPATNIGVCVDFCKGSEANPICEDPRLTCAIRNDGVLILCLPSCDPLLQDCGEGQACLPEADDFHCFDALARPAAYGESCLTIAACEPGLFCAAPSTVPGCASGNGCCSAFCDLDDPASACTGAAQGQLCVPWYGEGEAPQGLEHLGACALPGLGKP